MRDPDKCPICGLQTETYEDLLDGPILFVRLASIARLGITVMSMPTDQQAFESVACSFTGTIPTLEREFEP
jgi:hypothetical protein